MDNLTFNGLSSIFELSVGFNLAASISPEFINIITNNIISYRSPIRTIQGEMTRLAHFKDVAQKYIKVKRDVFGSDKIPEADTADNVKICEEIIKDVNKFQDDKEEIELIGEIRYEEALDGSKSKFSYYAIYSAFYSFFILLTNVLDFDKQLHFIGVLNFIFVLIIFFLFFLKRDLKGDIVFQIKEYVFEISKVNVIFIVIIDFLLSILIVHFCEPLFIVPDKYTFVYFLFLCSICIFIAFPHFIFHFFNFVFIMNLAQYLKIPSKNAGMEEVIEFQKEANAYINKYKTTIDSFYISTQKQIDRNSSQN